jgi:hypothetical protein
MSEEKKHYQRPLNFKTGKVEMNFGAGGKASAQLIADSLLKTSLTNSLTRATTEPVFRSRRASSSWPPTRMS